MDAFRWARFDEVAELCARNMALVLTEKLSLAEVLARLRGAAASVVDGLVPAGPLKQTARQAAAHLTRIKWRPGFFAKTRVTPPDDCQSTYLTCWFL